MSKQQIVLLDNDSGYAYTIGVASDVLSAAFNIVLPEKNGTIALVGDLNSLVTQLQSGDIVVSNAQKLNGKSATAYALANFSNVSTLPTAVVAQLKGDTGAQGVHGLDGLDGEPGEPGPRGIQGIPGLQGEPGEPAVATAELISTLSSTFLEQDEVPISAKRWETPRRLSFVGAGLSASVIVDGTLDKVVTFGCTGCTGSCSSSCTSGCTGCTSCSGSCKDHCSGSNS